jgi:poly-gamma-glutamate synthesis protein (capsule biosynthesis protein)
MQSTEGYVRLAEQACGAIPKPVSAAYIWGEALQELDRSAPDLGLINLETGATTSEDYRKGKGINSKLTCS